MAVRPWGAPARCPPTPPPLFPPPFLRATIPPHLHRLYCAEAERSSRMSQRLGLGIAAFQGLSNLALNGQQGGG